MAVTPEVSRMQDTQVPFPTAANPETVPTPSAPASATAANDMLNKVVQGAHQTIDRLAERAAPAVQRLSEGVHNANDSLHQRADDLRELGGEWTESLRSTVREHPLAAVATAVAIGLLVARLTR